MGLEVVPLVRCVVLWKRADPTMTDREVRRELRGLGYTEEEIKEIMKAVRDQERDGLLQE